MSKWIRFDNERPSISGKTLLWDVVAKDGSKLIGVILWIGAWRKYALQPNHSTIYEEQCLRDIADFCAAKTREHNALRKAERECGAA